MKSAMKISHEPDPKIGVVMSISSDLEINAAIRFWEHV